MPFHGSQMLSIFKHFKCFLCFLVRGKEQRNRPVNRTLMKLNLLWTPPATSGALGHLLPNTSHFSQPPFSLQEQNNYVKNFIFSHIKKKKHINPSLTPLFSNQRIVLFFLSPFSQIYFKFYL